MIDTRKSYLSNYAQVYLWQCVGTVTSFLSMFVVMPQLSTRPAMFGIYSLCMSLTIFVAYADFGFMGAGFRHASESFVRGDLRREVQIVGFVSFILLVFVLLHAAVVSVFALHPAWLIANLTDPRETATARELLFALAAFSPVIVLQRVLQVVFGVRIEDYIYQRINITGNALKIASVFLFVNAAGYNIVGYFVLCQIVGVASCLVSLVIAQKRYHYDLGLLLRSVRFSRDIYAATKRLAFSSMYVTLAWVVYYEFDTVVIGKLMGAEPLAIYAVALSLMAFYRSLSSIIFSPFRARINHFVALGDDERLRGLYRRVMAVTLPAVVFPVVSLVVLMKPFVFCWVGGHYVASVVIAQMLILTYIDGFSSNPASYVLVAQERIRELYIIGSLAPLILWGGVLLTFHMLDVTTFGFLKLVAAVPAQIFSLVISARFLKGGRHGVFRSVLRPAILPVISLVLLLWYLQPVMPLTKSQVNVAAVVATGGAASAVALLLYYWTSLEFRAAVNSVAGLTIGSWKAQRLAGAGSGLRS